MYNKNPLLEFFDYDFNIEVDQNKVKEFQKYPKLIEKLHLWVRDPDPNLEPYLKQLSRIVDSLYTFPRFNIYRGINTKSFFGGNNQLGLNDPRRIAYGIKPGYIFNHICRRPTSFSFDIDIPRHFGDIIVKTRLPSKNRLVITDELMYCVFLYRKANNKLGTNFALTQKEIVVYNNEPLRLEVVEINNKQKSKLK